MSLYPPHNQLGKGGCEIVVAGEIRTGAHIQVVGLRRSEHRFECRFLGDAYRRGWESGVAIGVVGRLHCEMLGADAAQ